MEFIPWANDKGKTLQLTCAEAEELAVLLEEASNGRAAKGGKIEVEIVEE